VLLDINVLQGCVRDNIGDLTFKEAFDRTRRIVNITVTSANDFEFPRLLNYLTTPNVLIWSAACASCALKFLYKPVELLAKDNTGKIVPYHPSGLKWIDGSVESDLPMDRLSELFNVNHFIVSQVNPHVFPFVSSDPTTEKGIFHTLKFLATSELKHRINQLAFLGLLPAFLSPIQNLITQKYSGDITITPEVSLESYKNFLSNPTPEMHLLGTQKGELNTWPKMAIIKNHCNIELTLERCTAKLREQLYAKEIKLRRGYLDDSEYDLKRGRSDTLRSSDQSKSDEEPPKLEKSGPASVSRDRLML